jgi:hypothetical protein
MLHKQSCALARSLALSLILAAAAAVAFSQVSTTAIRGIVKDQSGAVIPSATLKLKDPTTGIETTATSTGDGAFAFASIQSGGYDLTATAPGFQNTVIKNVVVDSGRVTSVTVELKIGATTETLEVGAAAVQLETTSNEIGTTISNNLIDNLPFASRDTLGFALLTPGAQSASGGSTFNGLPNASLNISVDGMNNNSQRFKSGGTSFFEFAPSRLDAMEQITVSTSGLGADAAGQGAMQIRFTTKRGSNQYHFRLVEQFANEDLNANSYFNNLRGNPRPRSRSYQTGGSLSGPLAPFIPYLKNKLFFFVYFEGDPRPSSATNTTTMLTAASQAGNYTYIGTDGVTRTVNLLQAAAGAGFSAGIDPTIQGILGEMNKSRQFSTGYLPNSTLPFTETMQWQHQTETRHLYPTARVDYQITPGISWHGSWNLRHSDFGSSGPNYPGTPYEWANTSKITTYVASNQVDWTITPRMVNSFVFGVQSNRENFYVGSDIHQWSIYGDRRITIPFNGGTGVPTISPVVVNQTGFNRNNPVFQWSDTLTWVKGKHTLSMGGNVLRTTFYEQSWGNAGVLNYSFGAGSTDPVSTVIRNALPAVNTNNADVANAISLYSLLTARVSGVSTSQNVDEITHQYAKFAPITQRFAFTQAGIFLQDSFRVTPRLTLNYGLRWQFDGDYHSTNGIDAWPTAGSFYGPSSRLFAPGELNGNASPTLEQRNHVYSPDYRNAAPNFGLSWNPTAEGLLGKLLGGNKTVIGVSYGIEYYNEGINTISNLLCCNSGTSQSYSANAGLTTGVGSFAFGSVNLSSPPPQFNVTPATFTFPTSLTTSILSSGGTIYYANPDLKSPYTQSWNLRVQRELARNTVLEVRYVGNKSTHMWHYQNRNETNILENGFLNEFVHAKANLDINRNNGKGATFANSGLAGQFALPIFDAAFGANGTQPALAASSGYTSGGFITNLDQGAAGSLAQSLAATSSETYFCRLVGSNLPACASRGYTKAGYPINFFRANPYITTLNYMDDNSNSNYNGLQLDLRKGLSHGLFFDVNYTWSHTLGDIFNSSDQTAGDQWATQRNGRLDYSPTPFDHRHSFTSYWIYDLPLGKNRWLNVSNPVLDRIVGGWQIGGVERVISGGPSQLNGGRQTFNQFADGGVVFGNGFTMDDLRNRVNTPTTSYIAQCQCFKGNVADIIQANGSVDPKYFRPQDTPGVIGSPVYYYGKTTFQLDMNLSKDLRITERLRLKLHAEVSNFLNHPFLGGGNNGVTSTSFGYITTASGARSIALRGTLDW